MCFACNRMVDGCALLTGFQHVGGASNIHAHIARALVVGSSGCSKLHLVLLRLFVLMATRRCAGCVKDVRNSVCFLYLHWFGVAWPNA